MEALEALRGAIINKSEIKEDGDELVIGEGRYAKSTLTPFKSITGHYTLGALWFQYVNRALRFQQYNAAATKAKVEKIMVTKRAIVVQYLEGKSLGGDNIDATFASESASAPSKRGREFTEEESLATRRRTEEEPESKDSDAVDVELVFKEERPYRLRTTIMLADNKDFRSVLNLFESKKPAPASSSSSRSRGKAPPMSKSKQEAARLAAHRASIASIRGTPIIVVPSAPSASLNLYNAKDFLQDCKYVETSVARKAMGRKPFMIDIVRKDKSGRKLKYHITDSVAKFRPVDWAKVVAVFASGQEWQFKGWTMGSDSARTPVDIFSKVLGFHLHSGDLELPANIKRWAVRILHVHPSRPHLDEETVSKFWDAVDEWVQVKRPGLCSEVK